MIRRKQDVEIRSAENVRGGKGAFQSGALLLKDEFCGKGSLFNHAVLMPGASVGNHKHEGDFEVYYILTGEGVYNDNGTVLPIAAGDVAICQDGEVHGLENTGSENLEFIALILYTS